MRTVMPRRLPVGQLPSMHWINPREVALDKDLQYLLDGQLFIVPRGFVTDFASVPKILWWLFGPTGLWTWAAILHDWFCRMLHMRMPVVTAREADRYFRLACAELGVDFVTRWLMWTGVRWGALGTPVRRQGWARDAPLVAIWSALTVVPLVIATTGVLIAGLAIGILRLLAAGLRLR